MNSFEYIIQGEIIGVISYFVMLYIFKQDQAVAQDRSILLTTLLITYMILFGNGPQRRINKNIF
jgi:hypothetical protein